MDKLIPFIVKHWMLVALFVACLVALFVEEARAKGLGRVGLLPKQAVDKINRDHATLIDIRDEKEFAQNHIVNSKNLSVQELANEARIKKLKTRGKPVIVVCQKGQSAMKAAMQLDKAGVENVFILRGGIDAWRSAGMPLVKK